MVVAAGSTGSTCSSSATPAAGASCAAAAGVLVGGPLGHAVGPGHIGADADALGLQVGRLIGRRHAAERRLDAWLPTPRSRPRRAQALPVRGAPAGAPAR
jgi:hypothetical protein